MPTLVRCIQAVICKKILNFCIFSIFATTNSSTRPLCKLNKQKRQRLRGSILRSVRQSCSKELTGQHVQCKLAYDFLELSFVAQLTRVLENSSTLPVQGTSDVYMCEIIPLANQFPLISEWTVVHDLRRSTNSRRCQNSWEASGESADQSYCRAFQFNTLHFL